MKCGKGVQSYEFPVIKYVTYGNVMYNMVTVVKILSCIFESCQESRS